MLAREGEWDAQTMHLLSFAISASNVPITKKSLEDSVQNGGWGRNVSWGGGGGGISPLPPVTGLCIYVFLPPPLPGCGWLD